jgi:hypothetical protein
VQRQLLLARRDRFLFLADAVVGDRPGEIRHCSTLPLAGHVEFQPESQTREGRLVGRSRLALVIPLALPEWRDSPGDGCLKGAHGALELTHRRHARRLYAPLFLSFDRRQLRNKLSWRQLTVAESLRAQSPDVAVAYRIQLGRRQWMAYRSLAPRGNRSVLGQNLSSEFLMARFHRTGVVEELVEVE